MLKLVSFLLLLLLNSSQASITVVGTGQAFPSEPDKKLGLQLGKGYEYMGRLQILTSNSQLCSTEQQINQITVPKELPVALLVTKGGCSIEQKAIVASTVVNPPNLVAYLILEDDEMGFTADDEETEFNPSGIPSLSEEYFLDGQNAALIQQPGDRHLRNHHSSDNQSIKVAILHVGQHTFSSLQDIAERESTSTKQSGGTKIILNSKVPNESARKIFLWTFVSMACLCCSCFCLSMLYQNSYLGVDETPPPPRPVRRRLTVAQVRERFPSFHYHPPAEGEQDLADLECSICLDEYLPGVRVRQLPCQHVFHSTCICRWLVERHAVCPLCKIDLYEEEEDDDESSSESDQESHQQLMATTPQETNSTTEPVLNASSPSSWWSPWPFSSTSMQSWFSSRTRPRRRPTIEGGMLTELTEPLINSEETTEAVETTTARADQEPPPQQQDAGHRQHQQHLQNAPPEEV